MTLFGVTLPTSTLLQPLISVTAVVDTGSGHWKVLLPATQAGGDYTATASCTSGCTNSTPVGLKHLTFGDVWVCSGQSNMQLSLTTTFDRNATKRAAAAGEFDNLRIFSFPQLTAMDGDADYVPTADSVGPW